ncbi:MAG: ferritin family protein [Candidatus Omnitrophota bacterium]
MLSKRDYEEYLREMEEVEGKMMSLYTEYAEAVDDQELKKLFLQLSRDETMHMNMVENLVGKINKNYNKQ